MFPSEIVLTQPRHDTAYLLVDNIPAGPRPHSIVVWKATANNENAGLRFRVSRVLGV